MGETSKCLQDGAQMLLRGSSCFSLTASIQTNAPLSEVFVCILENLEVTW